VITVGNFAGVGDNKSQCAISIGNCMYTLYSLAVFFCLFLLSLTLAGISHHVKAISPIWYVAYLLNKLSAVAIPVCIVIDLIGLIL